MNYVGLGGFALILSRVIRGNPKPETPKPQALNPKPLNPKPLIVASQP